jgi:uncharacterized protein (DUF2235 family)
MQPLIDVGSESAPAGPAGNAEAVVPKNIVICCDGTNNKFGQANTNVVKLFSAAVQQPGEQVVFYDPGVGTFSDTAALTPVAKWATRTMGSAFGYGISRNLANAYEFLSVHFEPDDRIFLFGFSRGAYAARCLASLIFVCGLLHREHRNLISYAIELFKHEYGTAAKLVEAERKRTGTAPPLRLPLCRAFADTFSDRPRIHFLGVWDTVSSVGTLYNPLKLPYTRWNPIVRRVRHAIAIDERRKFFRQNLWSAQENADVKQVWFAGDHSDVGGGYDEAESGLSKIALEWMVREAEAAELRVDAAEVPRILPPVGSAPPPAPADCNAQMHNELDKFGWKAAQLVPRRVWAQGRSRFRFSPTELPRYIEARSLIHHTVFDRMRGQPGYRPKNLPDDVLDEQGQPVDWRQMLAQAHT